MNINSEFRTIDLFKFIFACLIPLLHIPFIDNPFIFVVRQYVSRLGVPFFFIVSGIVLTKSMLKRGKYHAVYRYIKRIVILVLVWLLIYSPLLYKELYLNPNAIKILVFQTPAFLWYLTSLIVASFLVFIISDYKVQLFLASVLYIIGTFFGEGYSWISGGMPRI